MKPPRRLLGVVFSSCLAAAALATEVAEKIAPLARDVLAPLPPGGVKLGGHLGAQIDLSVRARVAAQDVDEIVAPFRMRRDKTEWRSEFWGKWITSAIAAWRYSGDETLRALDAR